MFNRKGQAASTFQLLIAAIVAMAILGVLMGVLGGISWGVSKYADEGAKKILKDAVMDKFTVKVSDPVIFDKDHKVINAISLTGAGDIALPPEYVCFSPGYYEGKGFSVQGNSLTFDLGGSRTVKVKAVCGTGYDTGTGYSVMDILVAQQEDHLIKSISDCACEEDICCLLYLVST